MELSTSDEESDKELQDVSARSEDSSVQPVVDNESVGRDRRQDKWDSNSNSADMVTGKQNIHNEADTYKRRDRLDSKSKKCR